MNTRSDMPIDQPQDSTLSSIQNQLEHYVDNKASLQELKPAAWAEFTQTTEINPETTVPSLQAKLAQHRAADVQATARETEALRKTKGFFARRKLEGEQTLAREKRRFEIEMLESLKENLENRLHPHSSTADLLSEKPNSSIANPFNVLSEGAYAVGSGLNTNLVALQLAHKAASDTSLKAAIGGNATWNVVDMLYSWFQLGDDAKQAGRISSPGKRKTNLAFGAAGAVAGTVLGAATIAGLVVAAPILPIIVAGAFAAGAIIAANRALVTLGRSIRKANISGLLDDRNRTRRSIARRYGLNRQFEQADINEQKKVIQAYLDADIPLKQRIDLMRLERIITQCDVLSRYKKNPQSVTQEEKNFAKHLLKTQSDKIVGNVTDSIIKLGWAAGFTIGAIPGLLPLGVLVATVVTAAKVVSGTISFIITDYERWLAKAAEEKLAPEERELAKANAEKAFGHELFKSLSPKQQQALIQKEMVKLGKEKTGKTLVTRMARWFFSKPPSTPTDPNKPTTRFQRFKNFLSKAKNVVAKILSAVFLIVALPAILIKSAVEKRKQRRAEKETAVQAGDTSNRPDEPGETAGGDSDSSGESESTTAQLEDIQPFDDTPGPNYDSGWASETLSTINPSAQQYSRREQESIRPFDETLEPDNSSIGTDKILSKTNSNSQKKPKKIAREKPGFERNTQTKRTRPTSGSSYAPKGANNRTENQREYVAAHENNAAEHPAKKARIEKEDNDETISPHQH